MSRRVYIVYNITESLYHKILREGKKIGEVKHTDVVGSDTDKVSKEDLELFDYNPTGEYFYMTLGFKCPKQEIVLGAINQNTEITLNSLQRRVTKDFKIDSKFYNPEEPYYIEDVNEFVTFDKFMTFEEALQYRKDQITYLNDKKKELMLECSNRNEISKNKYKEKEAKEEADKKKREQKREEERIKKEKSKEETLDWIKENGSNRLKMLVDEDYYYEPLYATERALKDSAALDLICPIYVDTEDSSAFDRDDLIPTEEMMILCNKLKEKGFDASIVKLENSPENCFESEIEDYSFENKEGEYVIAIEDIFGTSLWGYIY